MERPHITELLGQTVTLHFPNGDFTTGPLKYAELSVTLTVNGWLVEGTGRYFSHNNRVYD